ncbi:hypothetical protein Q7P37_002331 [Cladosporium fusiforme]
MSERRRRPRLSTEPTPPPRRSLRLSSARARAQSADYDYGRWEDERGGARGPRSRRIPEGQFGGSRPGRTTADFDRRLDRERSLETEREMMARRQHRERQLERRSTYPRDPRAASRPAARDRPSPDMTPFHRPPSVNPRRRPSDSVTSGYLPSRERRPGPPMPPEIERTRRMGNPQANMLLDAAPRPGDRRADTPRPQPPDEDLDEDLVRAAQQNLLERMRRTMEELRREYR